MSDIPEVNEVYQRCVAGRFGAFTRTRSWWEHRVRTNPIRHRRRELIGWMSTTDRLVGYVVVEPHEHGTQIVELQALGRDAYVGLLRHLVHVHDGCVRWSAPVDDPLPMVARQPYRLRPRLEPDKMFRIVDVGAVLDAAVQASRANISLTVAVEDDHGPWNTRTWRVGPSRDDDCTVIPIDTSAGTVVPVHTVAAMLGGQPVPPPCDDDHQPGGGVVAGLAGMLRPGAPAYCREDL